MNICGMLLSIFIIFTLVTTNRSQITYEDEILHQTRLGNVTGLKRTTKDNRYVFVFKRIPYAKPPIHNLRFRKSELLVQWESPVIGTTYGPSCYQHISQNDFRLIPNKYVSENCLFLNIFVPNDLQNDKKRAVMVWIHGGGFVSGQGMMFDGGELALRGDVIVVTINYRLNVFGFFTTGDHVARGNYGIWDQRTALQWIKTNIMDYGGNPETITVFGESAGGTSVNVLAMSPLNMGLFQRVIIQSGTIVGPTDNRTNAILTSKLISSKLNCRQNTSEGIFSCLTTKSSHELLQAFEQASGFVSSSKDFTFIYALGPIEDGELLSFNPRKEIVKSESRYLSKTFRNIDLMIGTNNGEGGLTKFKMNSCQHLKHFNVSQGIPSEAVCKCMAPAINREYFISDCPDVSGAICNKYSPGKGHSIMSQTAKAVDLYNDASYFNPTASLLMAHSKISSKASYQYLFSHKPKWGLIKDRPEWLSGANHADELVFIFGLEAWYPSNKNITREEKLLSESMMDYWTQFAKHGNPNKKGLPNWPTFTSNRKSFINLDIRISPRDSFFTDRMHFWQTVLPNKQTNCNTSGTGIIRFSYCLLFVIFVFMLIVKRIF